MLTKISHMHLLPTKVQLSWKNQFMEVSKRNLNNQKACSAQIRSTTHSKTYLEANIKTMVLLLCKCKHHLSLITNTKSKLSHWWMLREACSIIKIKKERSHLYFHQFHASHKVNVVYSGSEEITTHLTLLSIKQMFSLPKSNHLQ
jgi:hypothetical protein